MEVAVGQILEGKVTGITGFGAFVDLGDGKTGMVHISEVAPVFVNNIRDHLTEGETVKVKVLKIGEDGKIALSIKRAAEPQRPQGQFRHDRPGAGGYGQSRPPANRPPVNRPQPAHKAPQAPPPETIPGYEATVQKSGSPEFEEMMSRFKQKSEEKISDLKRKNNDARRSKRGGSSR